MLKLLLGHWKSHRKKPSLLPEDGDIRFEEPSRINPLFEDSDESTTSSKSPSDLTPSDQIASASHVLSNEENQNQTNDPVVNDLIDVSVPKITSDNLETAIEETDTEVVVTNLDTIPEATESISSETNLKSASEIGESFSKSTYQKTVLKETETTAVTDSEKNKVNDASKNQGSLSNKPQSNSGNVKDEYPTSYQRSPQLEQFSNEETKTNLPLEDSTKADETSADSMRIFEQPSISAIKHTKLTSEEAASEKIVSQSSKPQTHNKSGNKPPENINGKYESKNDNRVSKTTKFNEKNSISKPVQPNQQPADLEKPAKLRARAIDELIKKFQGSSSESVIDQTSSDKKSLLNSPTEKSDAITNVAKTEKNPLTAKSDKSTKETKVTSTPEKINVTETKPIQPSTSKKSEIEKEALSNIFKFPPPPPIDKLQNESSLHGKIVKERKSTEVLASSNVLTSNGNNSKESDASKTRSDSSLDRTRTASSSKLEAINEQKSHSETINKLKDSLKKQPKQPIEQLQSDNKKSRTKDLAPQQTSAKEPEIEKVNLLEQKASTSSVNNAKSSPETVPNKTDLKPPTGGLFEKKESSVSNSETKPQTRQENSSNLHKKSVSGDQKKVSDFPTVKKKSSLSNKFPKDLLNNESENVKSHSEDSGITRGDQISSETTQEAVPVNSPPEETPPAQNPIRKSRRDKKLRSVNKKACKNCKRSHEDNASIKKCQYDAYYDGLTGNRHLHKSKNSDSFNSDLSWEEKELIRRLRRSKRGTVRSNTPSTRSRHSRHRFINDDNFRRHHNFQRSSDESSFYGASLCSCDDCWVTYVKDYAYTRASLRGMPPIHEMCTCRSSRHNFLGRRVKFRSDPIPEASPSERTTETSTPAPSAQNKQQEDNEETDDRSSSQQSSRTKDDDSVLKHPGGIKEKNAKFPEEAYRFVSPWELEEWDLLMKKELLKRRRRRARCMGIMALAMVVFVGLVVAILMVYLRRKII